MLNAIVVPRHTKGKKMERQTEGSKKNQGKEEEEGLSVIRVLAGPGGVVVGSIQGIL